MLRHFDVWMEERKITPFHIVSWFLLFHLSLYFLSTMFFSSSRFRSSNVPYLAVPFFPEHHVKQERPVRNHINIESAGVQTPDVYAHNDFFHVNFVTSSASCTDITSTMVDQGGISDVFYPVIVLLIFVVSILMIHSLFIFPLGTLGCGRLVDKSVGNHAVPIVLNIFYPAVN